MGAYRGWQIIANLEYIPGKFDADHLRRLHGWQLQDIYPEVGNTRADEYYYHLRLRQRNPAHVVTMATRRTGDGGEDIRLLPASEVNNQLNQLAAHLAAENYLMGFDLGEFAGRLAVYYKRYAHVEPFTGGSKQVLRTLFRLLGHEAGYEVHLDNAPQLSSLTDAILGGGFPGDREQLEALLASVTTAGEGAEAALRRKITMQVVRPKGAPEW